MNIPGFSAEAALSRPIGYYNAQASLLTVGAHNRVVAALPPRDSDTPQNRIEDCIDACMESGQSREHCSAKCRRSGIPPYQCKEQDNSVNHYLCLGGIWAWEQACKAECDLLGPIAATICNFGCTLLADRMRADCTPATICV